MPEGIPSLSSSPVTVLWCRSVRPDTDIGGGLGRTPTHYRRQLASGLEARSRADVQGRGVGLVGTQMLPISMQSCQRVAPIAREWKVEVAVPCRLKAILAFILAGKANSFSTFLSSCTENVMESVQSSSI